LKKLVSFAGFVAVAATVLAASASANHSWGGYHWARTSNPFALKLGDNLTTTDWKGHLAQTSGDWSKSTVLDTTIVTGQARGRCKATSGRDEICNGSYGYNGWLGVATIWLTSGNHITQGTVKVNDTYFALSQYNNASEKEHVMCQEVGHTFGLDHQDTSGASLNTCMDYYSNTSGSDTKSTTPNAGDYDELLCIYDPADSGKTLSSPPHSCTGTGHLDSSSTVGSPTTYVSDVPGGGKEVTFVFWANPIHSPI
jgi:hypothetical protein